MMHRNQHHHSTGFVLVLLLTALTGWTASAPQMLVQFTNTWRYNQSTAYTGATWTTPAFDDSGLPQGRGVLAVEDSNTFVTSRTNTALTIGRNTYYFRTRFVFTGSTAGLVLTFSNLVDDGAVFYLNGREVQRLYLPAAPASISYDTAATSHEATAFEVFTLSGPIVETNLVQGTNVLAVEVHQASAGSSDIVFGCSVSATFTEFTPLPLRFPLTPPSYGYTTINAFPGASFGSPVTMDSPPGETNRLFVVDKAGYIYVITNLAAPTRTTFLNLSARVVNNGESGLLGLAFHPGYATNRLFFVFYSVTATTAQGANSLHQRLARFETDPSNPNAALPGSEQILITQADPASNHNGGDVHFGPDGLLYVSVGDGGPQYDGARSSQTITSNFFSAILRLDVDSPFRASSLLPNPHPANTNGGVINYRIPVDNPFLGRTSFDGLPLNTNRLRTEFYAVGFRNPWRFSFDPATGRLYCGDVGQDTYEEVSVITKGGNYGWAYREGLHNGYRAGTPVEPLIDPIQEYSHGSGPFQGNSVSGGLVYRGSRLAQLHGWYVFADYASGNIWALHHDGTNTIPFQRLTGRTGIAAFGTDPGNGDVLLANVSDGNLYRLVYNTNATTGAALPPTLADTGAFTNLSTLTRASDPLAASSGLQPYEINVPFWSDNARKSRWFLAGTNLAMGFQSEAHWAFPDGLAWVKHFDFEMTNGAPDSVHRLETRFLIKNSNGVYGLTYRWGNSLTNATLVPEEGLDESLSIYEAGGIRTQVWHYPSRSECLACHTAAGGYGLGFNTLQLNRDFNYPGGSSNQLRHFHAAGWFSNTVPAPEGLRALAAATNQSVSLEWRVRSYLAANCAQCHQPGGPGLGFWTAHPAQQTAQAGLINGPLRNDAGDTNNRVVVPGAPTNSMLLNRISRRGPGQMPPLGSNLLDTNGVALLRAWITNALVGHQTFAEWQVSYFGATNAAQAGAEADPDADGASNASEYLAGTSPVLAAEVWRIESRMESNRTALSFTQPANRAVEVQWTDRLAQPVNWQPLLAPETRPDYPASSREISIGENLTNGPFRFYRVKLSTP